MWRKAMVAVVVGLAIVGIAVASALRVGARRWRNLTDDLIGELTAGLAAPNGPVAAQRYDPGELDGLPAPVQRYFETVLTPGQPLVVGVTIEHTGTFNMGTDREQWVPFTSSQRVVTQAGGMRPGFVWDARMPMIPVMPRVEVRVHDAYVRGEGTLRAALFGLVPVMEMAATPEVAHGEFLRYLAECAWYPTALLPSQGVRWEAVDDTSARATLVDGATRATLLFHFDEQGLIDWVRAEARGRTVGDTVVNTPWEGRWRAYQPYVGMVVPTEGEVLWLLPEGELPYWRGQVVGVGYEFAPGQAE